jgi:phosphorylase kinase alpha/beta subunit
MKYHVHNSEIASLIKDRYNSSELKHLFNLLKSNKTFYFRNLRNGLFPAADLSSDNSYTNYDKVWVRDNIFVAYTHYLNGMENEAIQTVRSLSAFFYKYKHRFEDIINGKTDFNIPMNRPHIRFNGADLSESPEIWAHAENDALGYYFWFLTKLANEKKLTFTEEEKHLFSLYILFFQKIEFWKDEDSGHWEETRKIEASSIGPVTRALVEALTFLEENPHTIFSFENKTIDSNHISELIEKGKQSLLEILPNECIQRDKLKYRESDAALLFLIYPLDIPFGLLGNEELESSIIKNVINNLQGDYGIRRYLGDSFWTADTKKKQSQDEITADYSDRIEDRNKNHVWGEEAQWCIFDSILSVIYGIKFNRNNKKEYKDLQTHYFNRALAQITGDDCEFGSFKCPEMYYLEDGEYVVNDTVPLLWAQANLWLAFYYMGE